MKLSNHKSGAISSATSFTDQELADSCMVNLELVKDLDQLGLISKIESRYRASDIQVIKIVVKLSDLGISARHLKGIKTAVNREIALVDAITAPTRLRNIKQPEHQAQDQKIEILNAFLELHVALLRAASNDKL